MESKEMNYLFHQGTYYHSYNYLGVHKVDEETFVFRVWAPNAKAVSVVGDFNGWNNTSNMMHKVSHGIWEVHAKNVHIYDCYKYQITTKKGTVINKADPYAFHSQTNGNDASKVFVLDGYEWTDAVYLKSREKRNHYKSPLNI